MATSKITVDEGATTNLATNSFTEDAVTKHVSRSVLNNSSGTEIGTNANPIQVGDGGVSLTVDGSVSLSAVTPGTGATNLGKAEDAAHTSGDVGVMALSVRQDTAAALAGTDADYQPLITDASGRLHVNVGNTVTVGSHAVTNAGTFVVQENGAALTALQLIDDIVYTDDTSTHSTGTSKGALFMAAATPTDASVNANDIGAVAMTTDRKLHVSVQDAIPAGNNNIGDVDVASIAAGNNVIGQVKITDGTDIADVLDLTNSNPVAVAIVDGSGTQITSFGGGTQYTEGDIDASITGTAVLWEDGSDTLRAVSSAKPLPVNIVAGAAGDGAILDGVSSSIKATVLDYTNSNPIAVRLSDTNGDYVAAGAGTQYTEDAAAAADPVGGMIMAVRADSLAAVTTTDGDNIAARSTNKGEIYVKHVDSIPVTNTGTFAVQAAQSGTWNVTNVSGTVSLPTGASTLAEQQSQTTSLQLIDDAIVADDAAFTPATTKLMMAGFTFDDVAPDSVNEGDAGAGRMSANRNIYTTIRDAAGNERGVNVNASNQMSVSVDNTVTVGSHAVTNAGTFVVQENGAALTSLQLIDDVVATLGTTTYSEATTKGLIIGAVRRDADTTLVDTTNEISPLHVDANGRLKVEAFSGETLPVSLASVPSHAVTNAGTFAVQVDGAALTSLQLIDDAVFTDDAAFTPATSKVLGIGLQADETSTDSVDEGDIGAPRMTLDRKVIVTNQPHSAGGCSIFRSLDLDETEEDVKTSAGCVYGMWVTNTATSTRWIKFYNATAANVTVGSTTPVITWGIPGNSSDDISGLTGSGVGIFFDTAICVAATTGVADADTGAPAANDVIVNIFYK